MTTPVETYEYAGFRFMIYRDINGKAVDMIPVEGQHVASRKEKHRRAALDAYLSDAGEFDKVRDAVAKAAQLTAARPIAVHTPTYSATVATRREWSNESLLPPPFQGHASEASRPALNLLVQDEKAAHVFNTMRHPCIGDESIPCPSCGAPTIVVSIVHDESISQCPSCSQPKAPK